jgi:hypothetical protein
MTNRDRDLDRLWESHAADLRPERVNQIVSQLVHDLTPVRPLPPAGLLTTAFALISAALVLLGGLALGDRALLRMDLSTAVFTFAALAASVCLLAFALSGEMAPGSRRVAPPWMLALGILFGMAVLFAALFPYHEERNFWLQAWRCLRVGLAAGALGAALFWLILRHGALLHRRTSGALAGLLGGLTGAAILEVHCPNFDNAHILVGHWGAAALGAGLGWLAGVIADKRA